MLFIASLQPFMILAAENLRRFGAGAGGGGVGISQGRGWRWRGEGGPGCTRVGGPGGTD